MNDVLEIVKYTVPSLITGLVLAYLLRQFMAQESKKQRFEAFVEKKKQGLPLKLQAYERLTLYMERIDLNHLLTRIESLDLNKIKYAQALIANINLEYEHNLVQQIYVSANCWKAITDTKNTLLNNITALSMEESIVSGEDLKKALIQENKNEISPAKITQQMIREEVQQLF